MRRKSANRVKDALSEEDWEKLINSEELSVNNQQGLQYRVFVNIMTHFGRQGRSQLRELRKDSFAIKVDEEGREYVLLAGREEQGMMAEQPDDPNCPVKSFKKYVSKLHKDCQIFFTSPNFKADLTRDNEPWYTKKPCGVNSIQNWMTDLSKSVNLSRIYTNHCLQLTVVSRLANAGYDNRTIMAITGHKCESGIRKFKASSKSSSGEKRTTPDISSLLSDTQGKRIKRRTEHEEVTGPENSTLLPKRLQETSFLHDIISAADPKEELTQRQRTLPSTLSTVSELTQRQRTLPSTLSTASELTQRQRALSSTPSAASHEERAMGIQKEVILQYHEDSIPAAYTQATFDKALTEQNQKPLISPTHEDNVAWLINEWHV